MAWDQFEFKDSYSPNIKPFPYIGVESNQVQRVSLSVPFFGTPLTEILNQYINIEEKVKSYPETD